MRNEYTVPEVIEIGEAHEVILGQKTGSQFDADQALPSSLDLDE